jgi:NTP pyrophosphatase (non-canonical NTP hydrolase)
MTKYLNHINMTYYLYHIPGKKIGVTRNLEERVHKQQGYQEGEYVILAESKDITEISNLEIQMQKAFGYKVDRQLYKNLKCNNKEMKINVTEQTTTFPMPLNKLKGRLMDNIGMSWETIDGGVSITSESIKWVVKNAKTSMYNEERCYIYNKAFARWFDNNDPYNGKTKTGALAPTGVRQTKMVEYSAFENIRIWADERGLYDKGDPKTQYVKLMEEAGEVGRAILKIDIPEIKDGIGDMVVVLTNLAHLCDLTIEECIEAAYNEIKDRTGKMNNGTFKKD